MMQRKKPRYIWVGGCVFKVLPYETSIFACLNDDWICGPRGRLFVFFCLSIVILMYPLSLYLSSLQLAPGNTKGPGRTGLPSLPCVLTLWLFLLYTSCYLSVIFFYFMFVACLSFLSPSDLKDPSVTLCVRAMSSGYCINNFYLSSKSEPRLFIRGLYNP